MVWRNKKLTGRKGWTGPGVVVAVPPTQTSFWISMRGCLLKCSSEQVRKATDAEWPGAELSKTLATELLKSSQRSGQRGYVDVETEGQPTDEPPADPRPDVSQILGAVSSQHQAYSRRFLRKVTSWIPRCQKLQNRVLRHDRVSLKANQAVSWLTSMSDRAWHPIGRSSCGQSA